MSTHFKAMNSTEILCYGSLNIDYVYQVNKIFRPGETIESLSLQTFPGGKGANQSVAAARAGGRVHHAGSIGQDGAWLLDKLSDDGINVSNVVISGAVTGHAVIQVDHEGENAICLFGGANQTITHADIDKTIKQFKAGTTLMLQNETSELEYMLHTAADQNMFICLNPSPISDSLLSLNLKDVGLLVVNEIEASTLAPNSSDQFRALRDRCPRAIIVKTKGAFGGEAMVPDSNEAIIYKSCNVKAVDTTAAGDTFLGYLVAGLSQGEPLESTLEKAARAAERCVTVKGAQSSIPFREQIN